MNSGGMSTSQILRHTQDELQHAQQALAASQAALTAARGGRDVWHRVAERLTTQRDLAQAELAKARMANAALHADAELLAAELASAHTELKQLHDELAVTEARRAEIQAIADRQLTEIKQLRRDQETP